ncbi:hypothetical protein [Mycolicibacterium septicum]|uniref:hypothetical protein n=1 Tax=Mycolicibacterium septicum TaxID=98668 RepID=UPI001AF75E29|nr:hypothetical protein [Mycolicibacterium septicum]QRY51803.1 hypothetical protein JVX95_31260 [Mycolicibacterium septicum]
MFVQDLIEELKNYSPLDSVFIISDGEYHRLGDTCQVYMRSAGEWGSTQPPYQEVRPGENIDPDEHGILLV